MRTATPDAGDIWWVVLDPVQGTEQAGRRPALVLSDRRYNERSTRTIVCPISQTDRGWPFDVPLPAGMASTGLVMVDQIRTIHRETRLRTFIEHAPGDLLHEVRARLAPLVGFTLRT